MASAAARPLLIFPFNGNGLEALDCLGDAWSFAGFVDDTPEKQGRTKHGHPVYSRDAFSRMPEASVLAVPGSPTSYPHRRKVIEELGIAPARFARVVHPRASVSPLATLGRNVLLLAGVVVTSAEVIGDHVCVLANSLIHHDVVIGNWSLVGSNVTLAGGSTVGTSCYVGSGTSVKNGVRIGDGALVG